MKGNGKERLITTLIIYINNVFIFAVGFRLIIIIIAEAVNHQSCRPEEINEDSLPASKESLLRQHLLSTPDWARSVTQPAS